MQATDNNNSNKMEIISVSVPPTQEVTKYPIAHNHKLAVVTFNLRALPQVHPVHENDFFFLTIEDIAGVLERHLPLEDLANFSLACRHQYDVLNYKVFETLIQWKKVKYLKFLYTPSVSKDHWISFYEFWQRWTKRFPKDPIIVDRSKVVAVLDEKTGKYSEQTQYFKVMITNPEADDYYEGFKKYLENTPELENKIIDTNSKGPGFEKDVRNALYLWNEFIFGDQQPRKAAKKRVARLEKKLVSKLTYKDGVRPRGMPPKKD